MSGQSTVFCCGHDVNLPMRMRCVNENRWSAFSTATVLVIVRITLTKYRITVPFQLILAMCKKELPLKATTTPCYITIYKTYFMYMVEAKALISKIPNSSSKRSIYTILPSCSCINSFNFAAPLKVIFFSSVYINLYYTQGQDATIHEHKTQQLRKAVKKDFSKHKHTQTHTNSV